jgi:hypothetical protein
MASFFCPLVRPHPRLSCGVLVLLSRKKSVSWGMAEFHVRSAWAAYLPLPPFKTRREYIRGVSGPASMLATVLKGGKGR